LYGKNFLKLKLNRLKHQMLSIAPKPACLIAHNGICFDFRLLMHELIQSNLLEKWPIPEGVYFKLFFIFN